jgi:hypothetical protein
LRIDQRSFDRLHANPVHGQIALRRETPQSLRPSKVSSTRSYIRTSLTCIRPSVWTTCPYVTKDGQFNPDNSDITNSDDFDDLANAVLYNGLSWGLTGSSTYSSRVATYIQAWFLNADTYMNPNLDYAQMQRGPTGQNGTHTGVLYADFTLFFVPWKCCLCTANLFRDLKAMVKVVSGVLVLRNGNAPEWTADIDKGFVAWVNQYIGWLRSSPLSLKERVATK